MKGPEGRTWTAGRSLPMSGLATDPSVASKNAFHALHQSNFYKLSEEIQMT